MYIGGDCKCMLVFWVGSRVCEESGGEEGG